ncbi:hypothetical protein [Acinetobacter haemolyticus]|uniref:Uncharacterized protein n=1 Tax=Acinetobacter haemolyticus TaxID=29430 RepID=A0A857IL80_ACIHA|nr:hypothetical protein [Acinetobacter haemolyticus]ENW19129.1 hypothetical protein F926_02689 [Acinetobacter haemolyticus NIPH 261]NAR68003.1 hypothetical protein [Acinetobacter haemolyticus]NAR83984.1 hypothetical protein [Acinetobacter haemolyticus]QHI10700.1 hypothetical protein AhaeAN59_11700 [Acinetobacter haemolyticus]QHI13970.1 hypothetical protein AhaeAN43_11615 [Acinetobacter haemolyticus]
MKIDFRYKSIIIFLMITSLSGCKAPTEIYETLFKSTIRIINKTINHFSYSTSEATEDTSLPFSLTADDHYEKIEATNGMDAYYIVTKANGVIEHYSLDGELQWSNIEGEAENSLESPNHNLDNILNFFSQPDESMEVRTEIKPMTTEWKGQVNYTELHYLIISSLSEQPIEIQNVLINRGYCKGSWSAGSKSTLPHYSASTKIHLHGCKIQDIRETQITTAIDTYFFEF